MTMSPFEAMMLICFGISWPISIIKQLRVKQVQGKSPIFAAVVGLGYVAGITHKILYSRDIVLALYVLNLVMVSTDLALYIYYSRKNRQQSTETANA